MSQMENWSRRSFLKRTASFGVFVLAVRALPDLGRAETRGYTPDAEKAAFHPNVFIGLEADGTVRIIAHRSEMGTGIRTSLPMVVADEMNADWSRVVIEQAIGDAKYGDQNTDGSRSQMRFFNPMREAGATARLMLEAAAAKNWNVAASECQSKLHEVVHLPTGRRVGYGELAMTAAGMPVPGKEALRFKSRDEFLYIGKDVAAVDLERLCTGRGVFGLDIKRDGMVYASIEHPPVLGGKVKSYDGAEARKVKGVRETLSMETFKAPHGFQPLGGVAVVADSTWAALEGRKRIKVDWQNGDHASYSSGAYAEELRRTVRGAAKVVRNVGDVEKVFSSADAAIEAEYYVPHLSHAPMEPPAATAEYRDGKVYAWAPVQNPQAAQEAVAAALGMDKNDVVCHVSLLGGGFGRKSMPDFVAEAAVLSKRLNKPVQVIWTREDDIRFDFFHSVSAMYFKAVLDASGRPAAWLQRSAFPPISSTFRSNATYGGAGELAQGWSDVPYELPNYRVENGPAEAHVRIGWVRSVANIHHTFGVSCFTDELAHAAGRDPKDYLLDLIGEGRHIPIKEQVANYPNRGESLEKFPLDTGRLRHVIELAAERSGWGQRTLPKGHALGIAARRSFLAYVATVVEVAVDDRGRISIPRVDTAVDAGIIIHPERVRAQFEGAAVFGASLALMGEITATNGAIDQSNFHDYPVARINQVPVETHVHLVESDAPPAGVGEPGVPPFAPALCNAIFAATGKRIRQLPLSKHKLA